MDINKLSINQMYLPSNIKIQTQTAYRLYLAISNTALPAVNVGFDRWGNPKNPKSP